ncbi:tubulin gamma complex associated family protein [Aspergillus homomorphus CBS 101889]|uniref:Spindle pole body component n=1 Tax=Aspergillus homomorphus (strain CBS 101889) TaxID=1450537 RepID=A0A395HXY1_ASPHC|nr:gamma-tubulin complex component Gcp6 [Aspergillus homomorphus CBS 101889]RAL11104.1 gamma-tubulin complex component Gcp6 [Aspergillus homomorphus CBS 101889]
MDSEEYSRDPFSSEGLWRISEFTLQCLQPLESFPWDEKLPDLSGGVFKLPLNIFDKDAPRIPDLDVFDTDFSDPEPALLPTLDTSSESHFGTSLDQDDDKERAKDEEQSFEDIWALDTVLHKPNNGVALRSWEKFLDRTHRESVSAYFSESGAKGFDAALAHNDAKNDITERTSIVRNDAFFQALFRLGLGWGSIFFRYNEQRQVFEAVHSNLRISGVTALTLNAVTNDLIQCGTKMQKIRRFVDKIPVKSNELSTLGAFSSAAAVIIYTLEKQLARHATYIASLLQVKSLFGQCGDLVHVLANIVDAVQGAVSEAELISVVLERAAHFAQVYGQMEALLRQIVIWVMEPWLTYVETWIGFRPETSTSIELASSGRAFALRETLEDSHRFSSKATRVDYRFLPDLMPSFVPPDQAQLIFETGRSLRLLKLTHPQHPIASHATYRADSVELDCAGTWLDIERIQSKASEYEARLRSAILKYNQGESLEPHATRTIDALTPEKSSEIEGTFELFDIDRSSKTAGLLPEEAALSQNRLGRLIEEAQPVYLESPHSQSHDLSPELTSSPYLSLAPLLSSQAILIDYSCLHMLFKEHNLRTHLTLQWRFQLLGDGFFTTRLSHALFDPEMTSGERKHGVVRTAVHTGLRLGTRSRETWPPASSELRLVLIGLLEESSFSFSSSTTTTTNKPEPHTHLSFSIRSLSPAEIQRAKNPHALEALDFLRLIYTPATPVLATIFTPTSLTKYDILFQHLLRLQRMVSVVKTLIRDSTARISLSGDTHNIYQRFRIEAQHFVLAVSDYCFHVAVGAAWTRFQDRLARVEACLERGDIDGTIEAAGSVQRLREMHERVLDEMLGAMFLKDTDQGVVDKGRRWLDGCFGSILEFAPLSRVDGGEGVRGEAVEEVKRLFVMFRKQVAGFLAYLRGVEGVHDAPELSFGARSLEREGPRSVFDHLLARLEVKAYY